jgi:hypothetical protein
MSTKSKSKPATPAKTILHEYDWAGRHRIVVVENGVPEASTWFENYQIANFKGYSAATKTFEGRLPMGIFRTSPVAHQVLGVAI